MSKTHCKPLQEAERELASNARFYKTNIPRGRMTAKMGAALPAHARQPQLTDWPLAAWVPRKVVISDYTLMC